MSQRSVVVSQMDSHPDSEAEYFDFTPDVIEAFPLNELSEALRQRIPAILSEWTQRISHGVPAARRLPFDHLTDNLPSILAALANAVASEDQAGRRGLLERSPSQGIARFQQHYNSRDLMLEDRILRLIVARQIEEQLGRRMSLTEHMALSMGLDLMSQQAVVAYVEHQAAQLRAAAEAELRYLSFLSHDLKNNLSGVTVWLQVLRTQLQASPQFEEQLNSIDAMQAAILRTIGGMGRLLQAEQLKHGERSTRHTLIDLLTLISNQTRTFAQQAQHKGIQIKIDVPKGASIQSDEDLLTLVLQNLLGNAIKFAVPGDVTVRAAAFEAEGSKGWTLSVSDEGPGIPPEHRERIFQAFQRGTMEGASGVGLGLAIASRAAALLGGKLSLKSQPGSGSTFTLLIPA